MPHGSLVSWRAQPKRRGNDPEAATAQNGARPPLADFRSPAASSHCEPREMPDGMLPPRLASVKGQTMWYENSYWQQKAAEHEQNMITRNDQVFSQSKVDPNSQTALPYYAQWSYTTLHVMLYELNNLNRQARAIRNLAYPLWILILLFVIDIILRR
jgi:hypothetical protein